MALRTEPRLLKEALVRVYGLDSKGKPVNQPAKTLDISRHGARLSGVTAWEYPGETIGVRYGDEKCRYRIVWVGVPGTQAEGQLGLICVETGKFIWEKELSAAQTLLESAALPLAAAEGNRSASSAAQREFADPRRKEQRFTVAGGADIRELGAQIPQWTTLHNLSMGGCYVETTAPLPVHTLVEITIQVKGIKIDARGFVTERHPLIGMRLKFTEMSPLNRDRLHHLLGSINRSEMREKSF